MKKRYLQLFFRGMIARWLFSPVSEVWTIDLPPLSWALDNDVASSLSDALKTGRESSSLSWSGRIPPGWLFRRAWFPRSDRRESGVWNDRVPISVLLLRGTWGKWNIWNRTSAVRQEPCVRIHLPVRLQVRPEKTGFRLTKRRLHANFTLHLRSLDVGFCAKWK